MRTLAIDILIKVNLSFNKTVDVNSVLTFSIIHHHNTKIKFLNIYHIIKHIHHSVSSNNTGLEGNCFS